MRSANKAAEQALAKDIGLKMPEPPPASPIAPFPILPRFLISEGADMAAIVNDVLLFIRFAKKMVEFIPAGQALQASQFKFCEGYMGMVQIYRCYARRRRCEVTHYVTTA